MAALDLLWRALLVALLLSLPCVASCSLLLRRKSIGEEECGLVAMSAIGFIGVSGFFVWLFSPLAGSLLSALLPAVSGVQLAWTARRRPELIPVLKRNVLWPLGLTCAAALLVLSSGFCFGGIASPLRTAATRFSHPLPGDNALPFSLANNVAHHAASASFGDWQSSDRPPLQTGVILAFRVFTRGERSYEVIGAFLQSLWIFAAWLFLNALRTPRWQAALILTTTFFSGFVFVNTFFVWPKLLAAAFSLAAYAACLSHKRKPVLVGMLASFAMLSHGGAVFFLIPLLAMLLPKPKQFTLALIAAALLYLPWTAYQRFYDPPGDRLLKWHLAGHIEPTKEPLVRVVTDAYRRVGWKGALANKRDNLAVLFSKDVDLVSAKAWDSRALIFFYLLPCLGFLTVGALVAPLHLYRRRMQFQGWAILFSSLLIWCGLMFGPGTTFVHQGPYASVLLAMMLCIESLWILNRLLAFFVCSAQIALNVALHAPAMPAGTVEPGMFVLFLAALAAYGWLLKNICHREALPT